ncbi:YgiT-type zinc finger protein [Candidatus Electrothrix sp.]|uniref:YgiT-type zinc finger protein n=1 Tax=Candidatus Electrothrix sp. TaxID=2170559 RepID=UPI004057ABC8
MMPFKECPVCGGELEKKQVKKLLQGGGNTVSMKVSAEVCLRCGERLYTEEAVQTFELIRNKLREQEFSCFKAVGTSFTVGSNWPDKSVQPTA